jgi:polar amino acid transport system ATP-binding protein
MSSIEPEANTPNESPRALSIRGLRKQFGSHQVLNGIDLDVRAGEVIALIGRSGSGKSTLLRCINGLERFDAGRIVIDSEPQMHDDPKALRRLRQKVGMIFQSFNLFPHLSAGRNISLAPGLVLGRSDTDRETQARALLAKVGLADKFHAYPDQLSGGQQQRVAIARALAMSPSILLCDEITSALDPELVGEVLQVVEGLAQEGMTLLMVTHEMGFARKVADRVVFMHAGLIREQGSPDALFENPQTPELKQFLSALV